MERVLATELAILEVRERQFHRFPFSIPALNALLRQANIVRGLKLETKKVDVVLPDNSNQILHPQTTSDYYRSRDNKHRIALRRGGF